MALNSSNTWLMTIDFCDLYGSLKTELFGLKTNNFQCMVEMQSSFDCGWSMLMLMDAINNNAISKVTTLSMICLF